MKRDVQKRFNFNPTEAKLLELKAAQTGLSEASYVRELVLNSQPVEAPPRQFYEEMEKVNRIAADLQRVIVKLEGVTSPEMVEELQGYYQAIIQHQVEIKKIVVSARYYAATAYEEWMHQVKEAEKAGEEPPEIEEIEPRDRSGDIDHPLTDPDLGWNALELKPPFLEEGE